SLACSFPTRRSSDLPLLGAAMVRQHAPARLLGCVRSSAKPAEIFRRRGARSLVVGSKILRSQRTGEIADDRLSRPPHFADDPNAAGYLVRLVHRGAIRAGRSG